MRYIKDNQLDNILHKVVIFIWYLLLFFSIGFIIAALPGYLSGFPLMGSQTQQDSTVVIKIARIVSGVAGQLT